MSANFAEVLLRYYVDNFRRLPWRGEPGQPPPGPYRVWLSEVMLQQTTVATVIPRFSHFLDRWPTVQALAEARDEDVMQEWAGLGYYARARNLIACARDVAARGAFPTSEEELRQLPGLGDYTSAAVAAIAFGAAAAPVDTNVRRVIARIHGLTDPARREIARLFLEACPDGRAGDLAQALMDLGSTICRPRQPRCRDCPLREHCLAAASGIPASFPAPKARRSRPKKYGVAWWIEGERGVWLVRRRKSGILGGMSALPGDDWRETPIPADDALGSVHHVFTHFELELSVKQRNDPVGDGWWQPLDRVDEAGLPTLYRRAVAVALARRNAASDRLEVDRTGP